MELPTDGVLINYGESNHSSTVVDMITWPAGGYLLKLLLNQRNESGAINHFSNDIILVYVYEY